MSDQHHHNEDTKPVTIRISKALKNKLEKLAADTKRSRNFLAAEAIGNYLESNEWQIAGIKKAVKSLDAGKGIPHAKVKAWVASLGKKRKLPPPRR